MSTTEPNEEFRIHVAISHEEGSRWPERALSIGDAAPPDAVDVERMGAAGINVGNPHGGSIEGQLFRSAVWRGRGGNRNDQQDRQDQCGQSFMGERPPVCAAVDTAYDRWERPSLPTETLAVPPSATLRRARNSVKPDDILWAVEGPIPRYEPWVAVERSAAVTVFDMSMAIVMGPTPPGTGVTAPATSTTES